MNLTVNEPTNGPVGADAALFERAADDTIVATEHARGPWDPRHCHGGPVAALLAGAVEGHETGDVDWQVARLTSELTRPVPVGRELRLALTTERPGRRVSLVGAVLTDDGTEVARARALRICTGDVPVPADTITPDHPFPAPPEDSTPLPMRWEVAGEEPVTSFASTSCEHRFAAGSWTDPGPVAVWIRLLVPVFADETPTGLQRVAAAADFGNGVSATLPWDQWLFINPDLTIHLVRPPEDHWVGLHAVTHASGRGIGLAESALHDR